MRRAATAVILAAALLAGCSSQPRRTTGAALPDCPEISTALFHIGMTNPRPAASASPSNPAPSSPAEAAGTDCTFTSQQKYGLTYGTVIITRPPTDPYQGKDLEDWADARIQALSCASGQRGEDDALPHGRTCYQRLDNGLAQLTLAGFTHDALVRVGVRVSVPGAGAAELKAGASDSAHGLSKQVVELLSR